jgi:hypothetical protein
MEPRRVRQGVDFLRDPHVRSRPEAERLAFLEQRAGLTRAEALEASRIAALSEPSHESSFPWLGTLAAVGVAIGGGAALLSRQHGPASGLDGLVPPAPQQRAPPPLAFRPADVAAERAAELAPSQKAGLSLSDVRALLAEHEARHEQRTQELREQVDTLLEGQRTTNAAIERLGALLEKAILRPPPAQPLQHIASAQPPLPANPPPLRPAAHSGEPAAALFAEEAAPPVANGGSGPAASSSARPNGKQAAGACGAESAALRSAFAELRGDGGGGGEGGAGASAELHGNGGGGGVARTVGGGGAGGASMGGAGAANGAPGGSPKRHGVTGTARERFEQLDSPAAPTPAPLIGPPPTPASTVASAGGAQRLSLAEMQEYLAAGKEVPGYVHVDDSPIGLASTPVNASARLARPKPWERAAVLGGSAAHAESSSAWPGEASPPNWAPASHEQAASPTTPGSADSQLDVNSPYIPFSVRDKARQYERARTSNKTPATSGAQRWQHHPDRIEEMAPLADALDDARQGPSAAAPSAEPTAERESAS